MPTYTWNATTLGQGPDWNTPADWLPQIVPDAPDADVVIPEITTPGGSPYDFEVTIGTSESEVVHSLALAEQSLYVEGTLAVGAGVALAAGAGIAVGGSLSVGGDLTVAAGAGASIDSSLTVAGAVSVAAGGSITFSSFINPISLSVGSLDNAGNISGDGPPGFIIHSAGTIANSGTIAGMFTLDAAGLRNDGVLYVGSGVGRMAYSGSLEVDGALVGFADGTLGLGTYEVDGGAVMNLVVNGAITADAATIILSSYYSSSAGVLEMTAGGTTHPLTQTLQTITPTGALILQYANFADAAPMTVAGDVQLANATLSAAALRVLAGGTIATTGTSTIATPVSNDGIVSVGGSAFVYDAQPIGGTLALAGTVGGTGTVTIARAAVGGYANSVFAGNTVEIAGKNTNTVAFEDWNGALVLDSPTLFFGYIEGFGTGTNGYSISPTQTYEIAASDTILLPSLSAAAISDVAYHGTSASGRLTFQDGDVSVALDFIGDYTLDDFAFVAVPPALSTQPASVELLPTVACFLAGTKLLTERGEVAVERLAVGDRLLTPVGGGSAPICWIGQRRIDATRHPRPENVRPIRVRADAFGLGRPNRDLLLSPDHAVFVDGVLIPVRYLVNGLTVLATGCAAAHYFHVELPRHDIVLAEGLPTESYLDLGNRGVFEGGGALVLHPDFGRRVWEREGCAELILGGPVLALARARLLVQARLLALAQPAAPVRLASSG